MKDPKEIEAALKLQQITVSHSFDTFRGGQKQSHFVSANFGVPDGLEAAEQKAAFLTASRLVSNMVVWTAVARGSVSMEEGNEIIRNQSENHDRMLGKVLGVTSEK